MEIFRWIFFLPAAWVARGIVFSLFTLLQSFIGTTLILDSFWEPVGRLAILILMSLKNFIGLYAFTYLGLFIAPRRPKKTFLLVLIPVLPFIFSVVTYTKTLWVYLPFDLWVFEEYVPFITQTYIAIFTGYIPALLSIWFYKPLRTFLLNARS